MRPPHLDDDDPARGEADSAPDGAGHERSDAESVDGLAQWGLFIDSTFSDDAHDGDSDRYHGRRRAADATERWQKVTLTIVGVALVATVLGALALAGKPSRTATLSTPTLPEVVTTGPTSVDPLASVSGSPATLLSQSASAAPTAGGATTEPASFSTLAYEAEAGAPSVILDGSAHVEQYPHASGGYIVSGLGNSGAGPPGVLRVIGLVVPATGTYRLAIYYANSARPGSHNALLTVSGAEPVTVTFTGGRNCCGVRYVDVTIAAGVRTITITNPQDVAPSIDRIVVSRP